MSTNTPQQEAAIAARGNVLVVAGAGAGKTRTLVDRCLGWLLEARNPGSIDQILMVTFTDAAAAEMRQRLRARLEEAQAAAPSPRLAEQLALLETAWIGTLHSFCFQLVRENFHALGLDPRLTVLPEERAEMLARQSLEEVLREVYTLDTPAARAIQEVIQAQGSDGDAAARKLVLRLHHYTQTLPDPEGWFAAQKARFEQAAPEIWRGWLMEELARRRQAWSVQLSSAGPENEIAGVAREALDKLPAQPSRAEYALALEAITNAGSEGKPRQRKAVETVLDEARFLGSLCAAGKMDPLQEDWNWSAPAMLAWLDLTRQFSEAYRAAKREGGGMDFHDLEQFTLQLLREEETGRPSAIAEQWRRKLRLIFVDEYQDINRAQEAIIEALGGEGAEGNRFLVGDVKQSIYRFRLADPRIFLRYQEHWRTEPGARVIALSDNFRSQEGILDFVNEVFGALMRRETGGVEYDDEARLRFGKREGMSATGPQVEWHLRRLGGKEGGANSTGGPMAETEQEARLTATRLMELKGQELVLPGQPPRRAAWSDMVILLRSPKNKAETYVKEFARMGIPLTAPRGGFYENLEVRDLLSLLKVLDNPSQDLPLLAVLRSPLVGLSAEELADIRLARRPGHFWEALWRWHEANPGHEAVRTFLERFRSWRRLSRRAGVSQLLQTVLEESGYAAGADEVEGANISRLLYLTLQFDRLRGEGLYRFLQYVEAQEENETEVEPAGQPLRDAVRLMSIHQSKGLEFPIVALTDLGKRFNLDDARGRVILDEEYGLCPQVRPPGVPRFYPSLPHWLAQRRQERETRGEELRLLYVAMTRAADRLILVGSARASTMAGKWSEAVERGLGAPEILAGRSVLDWLGGWFLARHGADSLNQSGGNSLLTWRIYDQPIAEPSAAGQSQVIESAADRQALARGKELAAWRYPFAEATRRAAKSSVSSLRREAGDEEADEAREMFARLAFSQPEKPAGKLSAAEIGSAHHTFLEGVSLAEARGVERLKAEAARLRGEGLLTDAEAACLDFGALAAFWESEAGTLILSQRECVRRELPFTARFSPDELAEGNGGGMGSEAGEFIVVQGKVDLAVVLPKEIWVLDFKTDRCAEEELEERVQFHRRQISIYAKALERIYRRPISRAWLHFLSLGRTVAVKLRK